MSWNEGFPAPDETEVSEEVQAIEADFADAPKGSEENPFTREEMVEQIGEPAVQKIESEAETVEQPEVTDEKTDE